MPSPVGHIQAVDVPLIQRRPQRSNRLWPPSWTWWEPTSYIDYPATRSAIRAAVGRDHFDLVWAFGPEYGPFMGDWGAPVRILDFPDLPDVMIRRHGALGSLRSGLVGAAAGLRWKAFATAHAYGYGRVQRRACEIASLVTVCSEIDRAAVRYNGRMVVVPNGYPVPDERVGPRGLEEAESVLLFQGTMSHPQNWEAAAFFTREVLHLIRQRIPNLEFRLVGRPGPEVQRLASHDGVVVVGAVDRMEDELANAHAVVVPMRIASGTRLKILEAWAYGVPVVSTAVGAEGLPTMPGRNILVADTPPELADACVRILSDEQLRRGLSEAGRRTVESDFRWETIQERLLATIRTELQAVS